ncbi:hypothetical protein A6F65_01023 [Paraurantiacibacter namhicola]|uniref:2-keto-4-pentenoate hydratase n=1 Tax=Paraurantiacibacter namhicola TaxID=645517 RepID=A0A1C7D7K6_9SPHN|nr:hypothetical protein A6F65_01023 [Paraurantiacibacter namhicola]
MIRARRNARALPGFPGSVPATLAEAYALQSQSLAAWAGNVVGWKVGGIPPARREAYPADWLVGPIFESARRFTQDGAVSKMPVYAGGFAAIEAEFVLRIGDDGEDDRLYIGAEIASSPVPDLNDYGPGAIISDFGNNNGLLVGAEVQDWRGLTDIEVVTVIDGQEIGRTTVASVREGVERSANFLRENLASRRIPLVPGTLVSCGALTGVHECPVGAVGEIEFMGLGSLKIELVDAAGAD